MERKGDVLFWEIREFETSKTELEALGLDDFVPRNDYKTAFIKALKIVTKNDNDRFYRRFNDIAGLVNFAVNVEKISGQSYHLDTEVVFFLNKDTGVVSAPNSAPEQLDFVNRVFDEYNRCKDTINSQQLRQVILDVVHDKLGGIAMRAGGGVYYTDKHYDANRSILTAIFDKFRDNAHLAVVPIYDDKSTLDALETAASESLGQAIEDILKTLKDNAKSGLLTKKVLERRREEAEKAYQELKVHEKTLREKHAEIKEKLETIRRELDVGIEEADEVAIEASGFLAKLKAL